MTNTHHKLPEQLKQFTVIGNREKKPTIHIKKLETDNVWCIYLINGFDKYQLTWLIRK